MVYSPGMQSCNRCGGWIAQEPLAGGVSFRESYCLQCGARTYADCPRPKARATVKPALRLPDVFPAYQTWRQHR
ncbi:MAG: hypothetical protein HY535_00315, partial [Chloroflexi bacterium]|nr:hypothetical protein [Chloroflexota bacterium]